MHGMYNIKFECSDVVYNYMTDPDSHAYMCSIYAWFIVNTLMIVVSAVEEFSD
jgi:hypothetical protein